MYIPTRTHTYESMCQQNVLTAAMALMLLNTPIGMHFARDNITSEKQKVNEKYMQATTFNPVQMAIVESFASVKSEDELISLTKLLKRFYADRLKKEMNRLWDEGILNGDKIDAMREEHFRIAYK